MIPRRDGRDGESMKAHGTMLYHEAMKATTSFMTIKTAIYS